MSASQSTFKVRNGFSLIEVLIGVLILALGLLGLAAVFPVVVRQQRAAADQTQGLAVARNAEAYLRSHTLTASRSVANATAPNGGLLAANDPIPVANRRGLDMLRYQGVTNNNPYSTWSFNSGDPTLPGPWELPTYTLRSNTPDRGIMMIARTGQSANVSVPQRDRLWPAPYSGMDAQVDDVRYANEPRYVWDVAMRRVDPGTPTNVGDDGVQFAVFVRRVDGSIRVARRDNVNDPRDPLLRLRNTRSLRLADVLTGDQLGQGVVAVQPSEGRVAVAVTNNATSPVPTLNGEGEYAVPIRVAVTAIDDPEGAGLTRLAIANATDVQKRLARQPGQKLIDNLGNVYTVVKADEDANRMFISPAASSNAATLANVGALQVVFTPQVPAAVHVFTMEPR